VGECKPLCDGPIGEGAMIGCFLEGADDHFLDDADTDTIMNHVVCGRGFHSSTFRLNASAFCGMGRTCRGCLGSVWEV
jgi:hypothetical protein